MPQNRKNIMLGTAGHVDHGKTALVKLLTGCNTDRLAVEQQRGLTIELGFAPCTLADERIVGIVDVPGHVDFIRNMAAGAHGVDVVILVVAADDSVMPQTREHLDILTLLGVRHGLVAVTKMDLVDEELQSMVVDDVRGFLAGTFLEAADICCVSNITGEGFESLFAALNAAVDRAEPVRHPGQFRMWVERSFGVHGFGTVATGIPVSGEIHSGQTVEVLPGGVKGRVRNLEVYGQTSDLGRTGECVAVNLSGVAAEDVPRGSVIAGEGGPGPVEFAEADVQLLPRLPASLKDNAEVHLHVGTAETMAKAAILDGHPTCDPGARRLVQLRLREPLPLAAGDRFVVRSNLAGLAGGRVTTLGGGRVLDVTNLRLKRNRPWVIDRLSTRRHAIDDPSAWLAAITKESAQPVDAEELARRADLPADRTREMLAVLAESDEVVEVRGRWVHADTVRLLVERIPDELDAFHRQSPLRLGMEIRRLAECLDTSEELAGLAAERLQATGRIKREGQLLSLANRPTTVSEADRHDAERIAATLEEAGLTPPLPDELAAGLGINAARSDELLQMLEDDGQVVRLDRKVILHARAIARARNVVEELFTRASGFTTMDFRDALGVSRKFAVPLLDYFDRARVTVRTGNRRTPGKALTAPQ